MRKKINKWFWVWQAEKEEKWLTDMAAKGLALVGVGYARYEFEDCEPGEYTVRMELLEHGLNHPESQKHISFIEETGAEQVGSFGRWVYFRKKRCEGEFELYTDLESRMRQLSMVQALLLPILILNLANGLNNIYLGFWNGNYIASVNLWLGIICVLISAFLLTGVILIQVKKHRMKKAYELYEK